VAEGAPLLRAYTLTRIEGSNPFLSATFLEKLFYYSDLEIRAARQTPHCHDWMKAAVNSRVYSNV
jgi:hypothetical protein